MRTVHTITIIVSNQSGTAAWGSNLLPKVSAELGQTHTMLSELIVTNGLWALLFLCSVNSQLLCEDPPEEPTLKCTIQKDRSPLDYEIPEMAMRNVTIHKGHSKWKLQVLDCTCDTSESDTVSFEFIKT